MARGSKRSEWRRGEKDVDDETGRSEQTDERQGRPHDRLSVRWAVILSVSAGVGYIVGTAAGLEAGLMAGVAIAGLLYVAVGG